jgi:hypothetical protein
MSATRPERDPITAPDATAKQSVKRSDLLNDKPRTTSAGSKGPAFTNTNDSMGPPSPSNPYSER